MYTQPSVPRSIGGVLDDTIQLYKASFSSCWVPSLAVALLMVWWAVNFGAKFPVSLGARTSLAQLARTAMPAHEALGLLVILPVTLLGYLMVIASVIAVARGERPGVGASLGRGLHRWLGALGAMILCGLVIGASVFVGGILGAIAGVTLRVFNLGPAALLFVLAPLLLVACYFLGRLQLCLVALLAEEAGPAASLAISWRLIGGHWWRASTIFAVLAIIVAVLSMLTSIVAGALAVMTRFDVASTLISVQVAGAAVRVFTLPLVPAGLVALYNDLKLRKEGGDLEARLESLPQT